MAKKVLVIDDSAIVRNVHSAILKSAGYEVEEAENGMDALGKINQVDIDLMLVDLNTPEMDGYTFCEQVRKTSKYKDTPILIVSTEGNSDDKMRAFNAGANLYLVKPVKSEELLGSVQTLLK